MKISISVDNGMALEVYLYPQSIHQINLTSLSAQGSQRFEPSLAGLFERATVRGIFMPSVLNRSIIHSKTNWLSHAMILATSR